MMRTTRRVPFASVFGYLAAGLLCALLVLLAAPAAAQTGGVRGKVIDAAGKPVQGAEVVIRSKDGSRKHEVKTDKNGNFTQIGLFTGEYVVTVTKDDLKNETELRVTLGDPVEVELQLARAAPSEDHQKKMGALKGAFEAGVAATRAGQYDEAIAKFEEAIGILPECPDCYYNIGFAQMRKKDLDKAAAAFEKAAELRPTHADTWSALADVYNQQGKPDKALEASNKAGELAGAGGGASASTLYNQGVILFNQNKFDEAKAKFEAAVKADPKHAESQFMYGLVNAGSDAPAAVKAFETYLQLAPSGPNAEKAKQFVDALKK